MYKKKKHKTKCKDTQVHKVIQNVCISIRKHIHCFHKNVIVQALLTLDKLI